MRFRAIAPTVLRLPFLGLGLGLAAVSASAETPPPTELRAAITSATGEGGVGLLTFDKGAADGLAKGQDFTLRHKTITGLVYDSGQLARVDERESLATVRLRDPGDAEALRRAYVGVFSVSASSKPDNPEVVRFQVPNKAPDAYSLAVARLSDTEAALARLDAQIQAGGNLDALATLVGRRSALETELAEARVAVTDAKRKEAEDRRERFQAEYGKFQTVEANAAVPATVKAAVWRELCTKWDLRLGDTPEPLVWGEKGPEIARGHLRINLGSLWPENLGAPDIYVDGVQAKWSADKPARYTGHENRNLAARPHTLRMEHPSIEPYETTFGIEPDKFTEITWTPVLKIVQGQPRVIPDLNLTLQPITPGTFAMGSASGGDSDERPVTPVTLTQGFWLGRTEVTQGQWSAVMGNNPSHFKGDDRPVEQVSWTEAMEFCRKLTERERAAGRLPAGYAYTLPTEAQWEYACRAGTTGDYAGSLDAMAWYSANAGNQTHPVGQKHANAWGLHDMHGNVWEWCADWYGNYPGGSASDPTGPSSGSLRVRRGGGGGSDAVLCRYAYRGWDEPDYRWYNLGFRLALAPSR